MRKLARVSEIVKLIYAEKELVRKKLKKSIIGYAILALQIVLTSIMIAILFLTVKTIGDEMREQQKSLKEAKGVRHE